MLKKPVYMDYQSTTPVDPRVLEAMVPFFTEKFGNPASRSHVFGVAAADAVEDARASVARIINAPARDIIFTSGATESNNIAIKGTADACRSRGNHIITAATEHRSVLDVCASVGARGFRVTILPVDSTGMIDPDAVGRSMTSSTILISVMYANNEIGTIHAVREIGLEARRRGILFHCDAAQAVGKIPVDVEEDHIDLLSISGHKMYGPKGIGALYIRGRNPRVRLTPLFDGGAHEKNIRSGTLNVPGIVGLGKAAEISLACMTEEAARLSALRDALYARIRDAVDGVSLNGHPLRRVPGNLNLTFAGVEGDSLLLDLGDIAVSAGSACMSGSLEPSYVLTAIGLDEERAHSSLRFSLGRFSTMDDVEYVAGKIRASVARLRAMNPGPGRTRG